MKRHWEKLFPIWKIVSFFILISCSNESVKKIELQENIPDEIADSVYVVSTKGNKVEYEMTAKQMQKFYDKKLTIADSIFVTFFDETGNIKSTLYSDKAEVDDVKNTITGVGNVVIKSDNGTMKAPKAILDRNTNQIFAFEGVTLIRNDNILRGKSMKSDINLDRAEIIEVSAEGTIEDEEIDF